jgi:hypothetical protein
MTNRELSLSEYDDPPDEDEEWAASAEERIQGEGINNSPQDEDDEEAVGQDDVPPLDGEDIPPLEDIPSTEASEATSLFKNNILSLIWQ